MEDKITLTINKQKTIALIAHDGKKPLLIQWCEDNKEVLKNHFLCGSDPITAQPHDPDVKALTRIAQVYDIPIAVNKASADFMIKSLYMDMAYDHDVINFQKNIADRANTL